MPDATTLIPASALATLRGITAENLPHTATLLAPVRGRAPGGVTALTHRAIATIPCRLAVRTVDAVVVAAQDASAREWVLVFATTPPVPITDDLVVVVEGETEGEAWTETVTIVSVVPNRAHRVSTRAKVTDQGAPVVVLARSATAQLQGTAGAGSLRFPGTVASAPGEREAATGALRFPGTLQGAEAQSEAATGSLRFPGIVTSKSQQSQAATGDNGVFLRWNLGDDLAAAGLSLSAPAGRTYWDANGMLQTVGANVFRDQAWERNEAGIWQNVGLAELGSSNLFGRLTPTKAQLATSTADVTDAAGFDGVGGFANWLQFGTDRSINQLAGQSCNVTAGTATTVSFVAEMNDGTPPVVTGGATDFRLAGAPVAIGTVTRLGASSRYLCQGTWTPAATAALTLGVQRDTTHSGKAFRITGWQCEPLAIATTRINAVGTPLSRATEVLSFNYPYGIPASGLAMLLDCLDLGSYALVCRYMQLGAGANPRFIIQNDGGSNGAVTVQYLNAVPAASYASAVGGTVMGRRKTIRAALVPEGANMRAYRGLSENGGVETVVAGVLAVANDGIPFSGNIGYVNTQSGAVAGRLGLLSLRGARGPKSQAQLLSF